MGRRHLRRLAGLCLSAPGPVLYGTIRKTGCLRRDALALCDARRGRCVAVRPARDEGTPLPILPRLRDNCLWGRLIASAPPPPSA